MSTFDAAQHPRARSGQFETKHGAAPTGVLTDPIVDPYGKMPAYPSTRAAYFAGCATFADIDQAWKTLRDASGQPTEDFALRWGAVERGRQLRREGHAGVPTALPESAFSHAQNDAELEDLWSLATEEPPGDGEASTAFLDRWYRDLGAQYWARRGELVAAGALPAQ